jgi:hypothetical protein
MVALMHTIDAVYLFVGLGRPSHNNCYMPMLDCFFGANY